MIKSREELIDKYTKRLRTFGVLTDELLTTTDESELKDMVMQKIRMSMMNEMLSSKDSPIEIKFSQDAWQVNCSAEIYVTSKKLLLELMNECFLQGMQKIPKLEPLKEI